MKRLYDELSFAVSEATTKKYSTSFSLGILALSPSIRSAIYAIYGYVRLADEIVDSFHDYDKPLLLERFKKETILALDEGISLNPILNSFQITISDYKIDRKLIDQFLQSMMMDLKPLDYDSKLYKEYIYGSAEVVGLMCLHVFVGGDKLMYETLKASAMKLGSAFQKVNFLRDLKSDYQNLGRTYFPDIEMGAFNNEIKGQIELEIENEFKEAFMGIKKLPNSAKFGVYLAYKYYWTLFLKIKNTPAEKIMDVRLRIPNAKKLSLAMTTYLQFRLSMI